MDKRISAWKLSKNGEDGQEELTLICTSSDKVEEYITSICFDSASKTIFSGGWDMRISAWKLSKNVDDGQE